MAVYRNEVRDALDSSILELIPAAIEAVDQGQSGAIFNETFDGRAEFTIASMHSPGSFQEYRNGEVAPEETPFAGAPVTVRNKKLGAIRPFDFETVEEVIAARNGDLRTTCENWAASRVVTKDKQCATFIRANATGNDGVALFATNHPQLSKLQAGDTFSNLDSTAAAVSGDSVKALIKLMKQTSAKGENGERITPKPTHLVLTDFDDFFEASAVLQSEKKPGTAQNDPNILSRYGITPLEWYELGELSGTTRWMYLVDARRGINGLNYNQKAPFRTRVWYDNDKEQYRAGASMSGAAFCTNWRSIFRKKTNA